MVAWFDDNRQVLGVGIPENEREECTRALLMNRFSPVWCDDASTAADLAPRLLSAPSVVLLDASLPDGGVTLARELRRISRDVLVLILDRSTPPPVGRRSPHVGAVLRRPFRIENFNREWRQWQQRDR